MLIRLRGCAGWSAPLLFAYGWNRFSHDVVELFLQTTVNMVTVSRKSVFPWTTTSAMSPSLKGSVASRADTTDWMKNHMVRIEFCCMSSFVMQYRQMSRLVTKPTKWALRPAKTQISLGIRPVWSESSLSACRKLGSLATYWVHSENSGQTGRMPRLI